MYDKRIERARDVLNYAEKRAMLYGKATFIICGKGGPTGKSWLCNELKKAGHIAIEISEGINRFVSYDDDQNHMCEAGFNQVVVVLNKRIDEQWKM